MTRSTKLLASLLFCALGATFGAPSVGGQVPTKSKPPPAEADCGGRVLPRTGEWTIWAEQMQGPRAPGVGKGGLGALTITDVSECGRKIDVNMPEVGGKIVFELVGEWKMPPVCLVECDEGSESYFEGEAAPVLKAVSKGLSEEEALHLTEWMLENLVRADEEAKKQELLLTHRATQLPNPPFEGVTWLLVVQSETQIRSFIYGGLNWQHHTWDHQGR